MQSSSLQSFSFFEMILRADMRVWRSLFLVAAMVVYGAFGSPTPEVLGVIEVVVGGLLFLTAGFGGVVSAFRFGGVEPRPFWFGAGQVLLIYGLVVGVLGGLVQGQDLRLIARDVIPFLFFLMPLFLMRFLEGSREQDHRGAPVLIFAVVSAGVLFALRAGREGLPFLALDVLELEVQALYYLSYGAVCHSVLFGRGIGAGC